MSEGVHIQSYFINLITNFTVSFVYGVTESL